MQSVRFFKTGKGQYGEGDIFLGVTVPELREIARTNSSAPLTTLRLLLQAEIHEERLLALIILVNRYVQGNPEEKKKIFHFYIKNRQQINNWDLVDTSAPYILGLHVLEHNDLKVLKKLLISKRQWDRRMAILATFAFIRNNQTDLTFNFAEKLLSDKEDLMHKATGWMLREAGKRDGKALRKFISLHGAEMPRTMLRYAIEKFSVNERKEILTVTKNKKLRQ